MNHPADLYTELFTFLKSNGVTYIVIDASGQRDEGQVEDIRFEPQGSSSREYHDPDDWFDYAKNGKTLKDHVPDNFSVGKTLEDFANDILDRSQTPNWWDGPGGVVELTIDLTAPDPITVAKYHHRVVGFQPAGTFVYDGPSGNTELVRLGYNECEYSPEEFGLLDDPRNDDDPLTQAQETIDLVTGWDEVPEDTSFDSEED